MMGESSDIYQECLSKLDSDYGTFETTYLPAVLEWLNTWVQDMMKMFALNGHQLPNLTDDGLESLGIRINTIAEVYFNQWDNGGVTIAEGAVLWPEHGSFAPEPVYLHAEPQLNRTPMNRPDSRSWFGLSYCRDVLHKDSSVEQSRAHTFSTGKRPQVMAFADCPYSRTKQPKQPISSLLHSWGGQHVTWHGCLFLLLIVSSNSTIPKRNKNNKEGGVHASASILVVTIFYAFVREAIQTIGSGRSATSAHTIKLPLPDLFVSSVLGPPNSPEFHARCEMMAYCEGTLGSIQFSSPFHGQGGDRRNEKTPKFATALLDTSSSNNPHAIDETKAARAVSSPFVHLYQRSLIIERRSIARVFGFLNLLGYFTKLERLATMSQNLLLGNLPGPTLSKSSKFHGVRTHCLSSLIVSMPFTLLSRNQFQITRTLGTGSEKSVFEVKCYSRDDIHKMEHINIEQTDHVALGLPIAVRCNSSAMEFNLTKTCANASGRGAEINHFQDRHLIVPLMRNSDSFLAAENSMLSLFQFLQSCCMQLKALNDIGYIHRDIKLGNILASTEDDNRAWFLLSDFGHAAKLGVVVNCSSRSFADPAHLLCPATPKLDVWCIALSVLKYIAGDAEDDDGKDSIIAEIKQWYKTFLGQKDEFRKNKNLTNGNRDVERYKEQTVAWARAWDDLIWSRLTPDLASFFVPGDSPKKRRRDRGNADLLDTNWLQPISKKTSPNRQMTESDVSLMATELLKALRHSMEIEDIEQRWGPDTLADFCEHWIQQLEKADISPRGYFVC